MRKFLAPALIVHAFLAGCAAILMLNFLVPWLSNQMGWQGLWKLDEFSFVVLRPKCLQGHSNFISSAQKFRDYQQPHLYKFTVNIFPHCLSFTLSASVV